MVPKKRIESIVTPIFTPGMGDRLRIVRMMLLLDQAQLAHHLGVSQQTISNLEMGKQAIMRKPFTLARFQATFGHHANFILFDTQKEKYNRRVITDRYWETKLSKTKPRQDVLGGKEAENQSDTEPK
jgi:transcriptional regulator with XRE-family HTH domain